MKAIEIGNVGLTLDKDIVMIKGIWTLPVRRRKLEDIFNKGVGNKIHHGLYPDERTGGICLSLSPDDMAKISLTADQITEISNLVKTN